MRTSIDHDRLRSALVSSGSDWIFRHWGPDTERNLRKIQADIDRFCREYQKRFGERPDPYRLAEINPLKGAAFFQIDTLLLSTEMKVLVWRILLGCEVVNVDFRYRAGRETRLVIGIRTPFGEEERYTGRLPSDFRVLRHVGVTGADGHMVLQGYYAARGI